MMVWYHAVCFNTASFKIQVYLDLLQLESL